jgi:hypothetical protein
MAKATSRPSVEATRPRAGCQAGSWRRGTDTCCMRNSSTQTHLRRKFRPHLHPADSPISLHQVVGGAESFQLTLVYFGSLEMP